MAIVDKLKDEIRERGGSVAGIKDIESAIKELNKLDNGGGGGGMFVIDATMDEETQVITLHKTAGEIWDALANRGCYIAMPGDGTIDCYTITYVNSNYDGNGLYFFRAYSGNEELELYAATEDDYPTTEESGGDGQRINFDLTTSGSEEEINYAPVIAINEGSPVLGEMSTLLFKSGGNAVTITLPIFELSGEQCSAMVINGNVILSSPVTGVSCLPSTDQTLVQIALEDYSGDTITLDAGGVG